MFNQSIIAIKTKDKHEICSYLSLYVLRWTAPSFVKRRFSSSGTCTLKSRESFTCSGKISPLSNCALSFIAFLAVVQSHCVRAFSLSNNFGLSTSNLMPTYSPANVRARRKRPDVSEDAPLDTTALSNIGPSPALFLSVNQISLCILSVFTYLTNKMRLSEKIRKK